MLADAIGCEALKFRRNLSTVFWGFLFVPLLALGIGLFVELVFKARLPPSAVDPGRDAVSAFAQAASPLTQLFCLIGAAALFGGDYRWESWRLVTPRCGRPYLMLAKALIYAAAAAVTVVGIGLAGVLSGLVGAIARHAPLVWTAPAGEWMVTLLSQAGVSWLQLLQPAALAALVAVVTRSSLVAVIAPIFVGAAQFLMQNQIGMQRMAHPSFGDLALFPGLAAGHVRALADGVSGDVAVRYLALAALALWILGGLFAAMVMFERQDLARE